MAKKKLTHQQVKALLESGGIDFKRDVFELSTSQLVEVAKAARLSGYRKSKNAPGATGRMYFELLSRLK